MNSFKQKLRSGEVALGQMVMELFTPGVGPVLAACGLDFVIYDMEHGRCDIAAVAEMIASCRGSGITPMARVPDLEAAPLARILDLGAMGIMVPRVETRAQLERIVAELKYPPLGKRDVALGLAHDLYRPGGAAYLSQANEETSVIVIVETVRAFENLEEIVSVPGLDVAWMGHYDLTTSMGIPAQFDHPRFGRVARNARVSFERCAEWLSRTSRMVQSAEYQRSRSFSKSMNSRLRCRLSTRAVT
jgi:2-keto-3-deoxy-L-rhamnonate aldolase RhmA